LKDILNIIFHHSTNQQPFQRKLWHCFSRCWYVRWKWNRYSA